MARFNTRFRVGQKVRLLDHNLRGVPRNVNAIVVGITGFSSCNAVMQNREDYHEQPVVRVGEKDFSVIDEAIQEVRT